MAEVSIPKTNTKPKSSDIVSKKSSDRSDMVVLENITDTGHEKLRLRKLDIERLNKVYYKEGYTLGRDTLYDIMKQKYKDPPTKRGIMAWLKEQKLHQLYLQPKQVDSVQSFKPYKPLNSLSADLIDFTNKPSQLFRYILVVVDNFSRFMFSRALTSKKASTTAKGMADILDEIRETYKKVPKYILSDDGSEFKGDYITLLEERGIRKKRTLAGAPQSNGMAERANGKLKMLLSQNKEIFKGTWKTHLVKATRIYNEYKNRSTGYSPQDAIELTGKDLDKVRANVKKVQINEERARAPDYKVGDRVRLKIPKGKLDKMSTPNWTDTIFKIAKVIRNDATISTKYQIEGKPDDKRYSRSDLQIIRGKVVPIPVDEKAEAKKQEEEDKPRKSERLKAQPIPKPAVVRKSTRGKKGRTQQAKKYEIEKLLEVRGKGKEQEVKIRWKGYGAKDDTWEPVSSIKKLGIWTDFVRERKSKKAVVVAKPVGRGAGGKDVPTARVNK